jgi:hypothetical protein
MDHGELGLSGFPLEPIWSNHGNLQSQLIALEYENYYYPHKLKPTRLNKEKK